MDFTPWLLAGCAVLALSALLWLPFVGGMTRHAREMSGATSQIALGRFDARVSARRTDELGQLAESINQMAERLEGLVQGQKRFLGDVAHELCSPLARIQTALGILERQAAPEQRDYVRDLQEEAEHMARLVGELLSFSKATLSQPAPVLRAVNARNIVERAWEREAVEGAALRVEVPEDLYVTADSESLQRALSNVFRNALLHAGVNMPVEVTAAADGEYVVITVADRGPGVPEEALPRLFDPFFRVDPSRARATGGVGWGLTMVKTAVESCGGSVSAANRAGSGLEIRLMLRPAVKAA